MKAWLRAWGRRLKDAWVLDEPYPQPFDLFAEDLAFTLPQLDSELAQEATRPRGERDWDLIWFLLDMRASLTAKPADGDIVRPGRAVVAATGGAS